MPITRKEKLKWKKKPKTHPLNIAPRGLEDKSTKSNFCYPDEMLPLSAPHSPSASYRTNIAVRNNPR